MKGNTNTTDLRVAEIEDGLGSVLLTGTLPASTSAANTILNYPTGYNVNNCYVANIGVKSSGSFYRYNDKNFPCAAVMTDSNIQVYIRDAAAANLSFKLIVQKYRT